MNVYTFRLIRPASDPNYRVVNEIQIGAFCYETALKRALMEAHHFAIANNIPYYRVEG